jgi:hypothetical protein
MTHDPDPGIPAHAVGWSEALLQLLPPTLTIEVSSRWLVVGLVALGIWLNRVRR